MGDHQRRDCVLAAAATNDQPQLPDTLGRRSTAAGYLSEECQLSVGHRQRVCRPQDGTPVAPARADDQSEKRPSIGRNHACDQHGAIANLKEKTMRAIFTWERTIAAASKKQA
jgi:hypothetical protein